MIRGLRFGTGRAGIRRRGGHGILPALGARRDRFSGRRFRRAGRRDAIARDRHRKPPLLLDHLALGAKPMLVVPAIRPALLKPDVIGAFLYPGVPIRCHGRCSPPGMFPHSLRWIPAWRFSAARPTGKPAMTGTQVAVT